MTPSAWESRTGQEVPAFSPGTDSLQRVYCYTQAMFMEEQQAANSHGTARQAGGNEAWSTGCRRLWPATSLGGLWQRITEAEWTCDAFKLFPCIKNIKRSNHPASPHLAGPTLRNPCRCCRCWRRKVSVPTVAFWCGSPFMPFKDGFELQHAHSTLPARRLDPGAQHQAGTHTVPPCSRQPAPPDPEQPAL